MPLRIVRLIHMLRQGQYEIAIHLSMATASLDAFITYASGAKHRIGCYGTVENIFFTSAMEHPCVRHKVDQINEYLGWLDIPVSGKET